ncbi:MAG TPA: ABC transporter transmembrane domain-containing protein [Acidimicrobiales bacterium]|nr:ABC transporter transmembrane domain-containing protein [Acidimicrobiales bacterium]
MTMTNRGRRDQQPDLPRSGPPEAGASDQQAAPPRRGRANRQPAEVVSPFVPLAETPRYRPPRATIDPDRSKSWLRRAWPIAKTHQAGLLTACILSFVGLVLQVQIPNLLNKALSNSIVSHTVHLSYYVTWIIVLGVVAGGTGFISRWFLYRTAYRIEFDLRNVIYEHLTKMSFSFYDRVQSGQLISRANSDIRSVQMYMTFAPLILVQCSIALVAFGFMLSIDVPLAFIAMVTTPLVYFVGVQMRKSMFPVSWLIQSRLADVATIVDENVNGVRVVKSFAAEDQQLKALAKAATNVQWAYVKDADIRAQWTPAIQNLSQVGLVLVLLFGGWMVIQHHIGVGAILAFNAYLLMMQAPFMMLGMLIMMGQRAAASAGRIYEILDERSDITSRPGAVDLVDCRGEVSFEHVDFSYPGSDRPKVLKDLNLHLDAGETVALVGRTGSGKSTIARLLTRAYDATSGSVKVDGYDVRDLTIESLRANVGMVLDEPFLFSISIHDNIAYGRPDADAAEVVAAAVAAGADEFIRELPAGYETVVGERGYTLSGGQRQRIAIARTLLVNPPILVLDDATSAIDVQVEQQIHEALGHLMEGRTTLVIAHRLSTISLSDRVVLLDDGQIVADGRHAYLLQTSALYAEVLAHAEEEVEADLAAHRSDELAGAIPRLPDIAPPMAPGGLL